MFQGCSRYPTKLEEISEMDEYTNTFGFYNIYPKGSLGPDNRLGFNYGITDVYCTPLIGVNDVNFTRAILLFALEELCVDHTKMFAGGHDEGGSMVLNLTIELPTYFKGFASVAARSGSLNLTVAKPLVALCQEDFLCRWFSDYVKAANCGNREYVDGNRRWSWWIYENCENEYYVNQNYADGCWPGGNDPPGRRCHNGTLIYSEILLNFWNSLKADPSTPSREEMIASLKAELEK
eukprot:TRINITY_DN3095_c0_g2_i1.p1 TRINITY_DN3095_c0_g2~~TRINITY_DN3095_c0_g2_i1.p1  ORF type:complete len:236 (+),score=28.00 TRINITY_DN3095_c0_g2_i1:755-1462(+)